MTPRDLRNIHTTRNSCRDALPCTNMALKLPRYFYLLMEKPLGRYFQVWSPYYQVAQCNQKTPIPASSRWQVRYEKAKKALGSTLITATTSFHLSKPVSTDLTIKPGSVLTNPIWKDGVRSWSMKNIYPIRRFYCDTITKRMANQGYRANFSPWGKMGSAAHQPSILMSLGKS